MARQFAGEFKYVNGYDIPLSVLTQKLADRAQLYTQHAFMRPYGVTNILISYSDINGPELFMADPAGHFSGYKACACGAKEQEAMNYLEKKIKENDEMTYEQTLETAILALQTTLGNDLKPNDIEIAVIKKDHPKFYQLTSVEIDEELTRIISRD